MFVSLDIYDEKFVLKLSQKISEFSNGNRTRVSRLPVRLFYHQTIGSQTASMMLIRDLVRNIDMPLSYLKAEHTCNVILCMSKFHLTKCRYLYAWIYVMKSLFSSFISAYKHLHLESLQTSTLTSALSKMKFTYAHTHIHIHRQIHTHMHTYRLVTNQVLGLYGKVFA